MAALRLAITGCLVAVCGSWALSEEPKGLIPGSPVVASLMRLPSKTLGGDQLWADEFVRSGWRIQRHTISGHYRLLDPDDYRRALGDYDACRAKFEEFQQDEPVTPKSKQAVVLLHGLVRSRDCMIPLGDYLAEHGGYEIVNVSYPSTQAEVTAHSASLAKVLDNLEGIEEVNFVAHSLGNLVIRDWMQDYYDPKAASFKLGRFVMLGPPNNGAQFARKFKENSLFNLVAGPVAKQLAQNWEDLPAPCCEFGILAGSMSVTNPFVTGKDDLVVSVEETKLPGAADFQVLPVSHGAVRNCEVVGERTLRFLEHGYFTSEDARKPLR